MFQQATDKQSKGEPARWQFSLRRVLLVLSGAALILTFYRQIDHEGAYGAALVCCGLLAAMVLLSPGVRWRLAVIVVCTYLPFVCLVWMDWHSLTRGKDWNEHILNVLPLLPGFVPKVLIDHHHWAFQQEVMGVIALLFVACGTLAARRLFVPTSLVVLGRLGC